MQHRIFASFTSFIAAAAAALFLAACATSAPTAPPTLYQRLGGKPAITVVVDQFVNNVTADWRIGGRFAHTDTGQLKHELATQICAAAGGPCVYTGRDMRSAHAGRHITEAEFGALLQDLVKALDRERVPRAEKRELVAVFVAMKPDVVNR